MYVCMYCMSYIHQGHQGREGEGEGGGGAFNTPALPPLPSPRFVAESLSSCGVGTVVWYLEGIYMMYIYTVSCIQMPGLDSQL